MGEVWKPISGIDRLYEVSNYGRVRNPKTGIVLSPRPLPQGYLRISIRDKATGKKKDHYIHRLVAEAFCKHEPGCNVVNHIDNDPTNNHADNLEWTTQRGNVIYAMSQGRVQNYPNAREVVGIKNGTIQKFRSAREAGSIIGCDHSSIIKCCRGKYKTVHGYQWKYAEVI